MLNVSKLKDMLKLYFVDPNGNIDHLFHSAMKRHNIFARPWVICQWLQVLHREHSHYGDLEVPDSDYIRKKIDAANKEIQQTATHVTSESAFVVETQIGSDVAQSQSRELPISPGTTTAPAADNDTSEDHEDTAMRYSLVLENPEVAIEDEHVSKFRNFYSMGKTVLERQEEEDDSPPQDDDDASTASGTDASNAGSSMAPTPANIAGTASPPPTFNQTAPSATNNNSDDSSVDTDYSNWPGPEEDDDDDDDFEKYGSKRWPKAINEFTASEMILTTAFPHVFILGYAYKRAAGQMKEKHLKHLLHQFHKVPQMDRCLLAYLTDSQLCFAAVFGVEAYAQKNPKSLQVITDLMNSDEEKGKLRHAIQHPGSDIADDFYKKYNRHFYFCGRNINHGSMEGNKVKSFILETQKRMQTPFCFLTLNMEEIHNPQSIRACACTVDNKHFPAVFEEGCPYGESGAEFMEYLRTVGETVGEGEIDFSEPARAKMAMDDPITFVEETKQMLNDVCSLLLGIPPEEFYSALDSTSRRKTKYFKCNKGIFGHCLAYVGVTEDHKKVCHNT